MVVIFSSRSSLQKADVPSAAKRIVLLSTQIFMGDHSGYSRRRPRGMSVDSDSRIIRSRKGNQTPARFCRDSGKLDEAIGAYIAAAMAETGRDAIWL
jgi:hypothetical protein